MIVSSIIIWDERSDRPYVFQVAVLKEQFFVVVVVVFFFFF